MMLCGKVDRNRTTDQRGAFTGATEERIGRFALADGGTILLDEIGDIAPEVQVRLHCRTKMGGASI